MRLVDREFTGTFLRKRCYRPLLRKCLSLLVELGFSVRVEFIVPLFRFVAGRKGEVDYKLKVVVRR